MTPEQALETLGESYTEKWTVLLDPFTTDVAVGDCLCGFDGGKHTDDCPVTVLRKALEDFDLLKAMIVKLKRGWSEAALVEIYAACGVEESRLEQTARRCRIDLARLKKHPEQLDQLTCVVEMPESEAQDE